VTDYTVMILGNIITDHLHLNSEKTTRQTESTNISSCTYEIP